MSMLLKKIIWLCVILAVIVFGAFLVSQRSLPQSPLFILKKRFEELRSRFMINPISKAQYNLSLAKKRAKELEKIEKIYTEEDFLVDRELKALIETEIAILRAGESLSTVEIRAKTGRIKISSLKFKEFFENLYDLSSSQSSLVKEIMIKKEYGEKDAPRLKQLERDYKDIIYATSKKLDDINDDGRLNDSTALPVVETYGKIELSKDVYKLIRDEKNYRVKSIKYNLAGFQDKYVRVIGDLDKEVININLIEIQSILPVSNPLKITISGNLTKNEFFYLTKQNQPDYLLGSDKVNLETYVDRYVKIEGELKGEKIWVETIMVKGQAVSVPATETIDKETEKTESKEETGIIKTAFGKIKKENYLFQLVQDEKVLYTLISLNINLEDYKGKEVEVKGNLTGNILNVTEIKESAK